MFKYLYTLALVLPCFMLPGQSAMLSSGGNASGSSGSVAYSVGQIFTLPASNGNISVSPGVQQPYEISEIVGTEEVLTPFVVEIFPNPMTDVLHVKLPDQTNGAGYVFSLTGIDGKNYAAGVFDEVNNEVNAESIPSGTYLLSVANSYRQIRTFKIVKK